MEKRVLLRTAAVRNSATAKENCGRKSLLIEHEVCHLKLESSQPLKNRSRQASQRPLY